MEIIKTINRNDPAYACGGKESLEADLLRAQFFLDFFLTSYSIASK
jgi:hypothetical protein